MEEAIVIIAVVCIIVLGYFAMARIDKYLNQNAIEKENEKREPSCIILIENLTDEEIVDEINRFREKHGDTRIMLCDSGDEDLTKSEESRSKIKR